LLEIAAATGVRLGDNLGTLYQGLVGAYLYMALTKELSSQVKATANGPELHDLAAVVLRLKEVV